MSISGGIWKALLRGRELGCNTVQIFTKNANQWKERVLSREEIASFRKLRKETGIDPVIAHSGYLINLAAADETLYEKSIDAMIREIDRCELLGVDYLVIHPGSHGGRGETSGMEKIIRALDIIRDRTEGSTVGIALETTAGQGKTLGYRLAQIARIMEGVDKAAKPVACIDTCHVFAAGHELRTKKDYERFFDEIVETIGVDGIKVIHLNDSKRECGTRIDRHEDIGKGMIGERPFQWIMNDERFKDVPKIIETPGLGKDLAKDRATLDLLRSFAPG